MLIYVEGGEHYLAKQAIDQLKAKYLAKNDGTELMEILADEALPNFADLQAVPLFATSRLVIIKKAGVLDLANQENLAGTLANLPPTTVAVIWDQKPLKTGTPLHAVLLKADKKMSAEPLGETALRRWLQTRAKELNLELEAATVESLLGASGGDVWFLETELCYLATAEGNQTANTHQKSQKSDEPFIYFRLVRNRDWKKIGRQLAVDFQNGTPFELLLGSLAAAIRKEITNRAEKERLTELLGDIDFGVKTGLLEPGDAIALLAHLLSKPEDNRVHWEAMWEGTL